MRELLDVTTKYATGEEAIQANFIEKGKATAHLNGDDGGNNPASAQRCHDKKARDRKHCGEEMVATVSNPQQRG
jgi:hypothetical protein